MYGMFRGTGLTMPAYRRNVAAPLRRTHGSVDLFVHAMVQERLDAHQRGHEDGRRLLPNALDELRQLAPCRFTAEDQGSVDGRLKPRLPRSLPGGAGYDAQQVLNLYRASYSMSAVADILVAHETRSAHKYGLVAVARPDTAMLAPLLPLPAHAREAAERGIVVPDFMHFLGLNDRFALGARDPMVTTYMRQYDLVYHPSKLPAWEGRGGVNSERILCALLDRAKVPVATAPLCVVRVRNSGECHPYDLMALRKPLPIRDRVTCKTMAAFQARGIDALGAWEPACNSSRDLADCADPALRSQTPTRRHA